MSSVMVRVSLTVVLLSGWAIGTAHAAVQCPASMQGHDLRLVDGGSIFLGSPSDQMLQAPDVTTRGTTGPINTWNFKSAEGMVLVCKYDKIQDQFTARLPASIKSCRQDARSLSFVCQ